MCLAVALLLNSWLFSFRVAPSMLAKVPRTKVKFQNVKRRWNGSHYREG